MKKFLKILQRICLGMSHGCCVFVACGLIFFVIYGQRGRPRKTLLYFINRKPTCQRGLLVIITRVESTFDSFEWIGIWGWALFFLSTYCCSSRNATTKEVLAWVGHFHAWMLLQGVESVWRERVENANRPFFPPTIRHDGAISIFFESTDLSTTKTASINSHQHSMSFPTPFSPKESHNRRLRPRFPCTIRTYYVSQTFEKLGNIRTFTLSKLNHFDPYNIPKVQYDVHSSPIII